ncbi:hypothetical protein BT96DRAFT_1026103 [Gymnopus androsaceus JB14]|uniref:Uso1/p115-like vesicle tethering protein C-terminal domain-containing protein n=1 Tax=Gymnopus androsaceus JB14 TaxID=1447944 RepID=A0A6A4GMF8_9AGAR|nr:hypothetical protein BT96DRAFT_1026103 [Gymnopus androsaceus JB14]
MSPQTSGPSSITSFLICCVHLVPAVTFSFPLTITKRTTILRRCHYRSWLSLAFFSRSKTDTSDLESREWNRLIVGYLNLRRWLWEDPAAVSVFLNSEGLGIFVDAINQYSRKPGAITRVTISPILHRLGVDTLRRIARLRKDERFITVSLVQYYPSSAPYLQATTVAAATAEGEVWFNGAFVDFWKLNYYKWYRFVYVVGKLMYELALLEPPKEGFLRGSAGFYICAETAMLISSFQDTLRNNGAKIAALKSELDSLHAALKTSEEKQKEIEKEQEDLLVLLDEVTVKRKCDKARLHVAGMGVSENEGKEECDEDNE